MDASGQLTPSERLLYVRLRERANHDSNDPILGAWYRAGYLAASCRLQTLADALGVDRALISRRLSKLAAAGWVTWGYRLGGFSVRTPHVRTNVFLLGVLEQGRERYFADMIASGQTPRLAAELPLRSMSGVIPPHHAM